MIAFILIVVGYVAATIACWARAWSVAQRFAPAVWRISEVLEFEEPDGLREHATESMLGMASGLNNVRSQILQNGDRAREATAGLALGALFAFALRRPFFAFSWSLSRRVRRDVVCRVAVLAAMLDPRGPVDGVSALIDLTAAAHELRHMLDATDVLRSGATDAQR